VKLRAECVDTNLSVIMIMKGENMALIQRTEMLKRFPTSDFPKINPSLTTLEPLVRGSASDRVRFFDMAKQAETAGASSLHLDVFDPNYLKKVKGNENNPVGDNMGVFDPKLVEQLKKAVNIPIDVHLMVSPLTRNGCEGFRDYILEFAGAGADFVSMHWGAFEAAGLEPDIFQTVQDVKERCSISLGIAFNHYESIPSLRFPVSFRGLFDFALFMTVIPGAGGKPFEPKGVDNMCFAATGDHPAFRDVLMGIDGAVNNDRIGEMFLKGGKWFVVGSYWFGPNGNYRDLAGMERAYDTLMNAAHTTTWKDIKATGD